jgi:type III secretion protein V
LAALHLGINKNTIISRFFQADIFLAITVITVVALLVFPIPTFLIDVFICANIAVAIIVLLLSIYIKSSLNLSSFPTILLLTTLFRLGLNVATSRLILLHADAGHMVLAFGNTVVGGNLVVGIVIFLLLMLINMLVVAKGSERVAEVAARFTLDAMPGKQMSIDADLRSGILDLDQAKKKRADLNRESQLFGAMDGAMKFVKGDVIAGIIIFAINIIAGIIIGTLELGMDLDEALSTFAILSVGDGLVSIIPGLLMSVCAGLIVTRVDNGDDSLDLGATVSSQVLAYPKAFFIAAAFIGLMAFIPGLPPVPLLVLSAIVLTIALLNRHKNLTPQPKNNEMAGFDDKKIEKIPDGETKNLKLVPICIEVAEDLVPFVDDNSNFISELIPLLRESLEMELGIDFPGIRVRPGFRLLPSHYALLLNEVPVASGLVEPHMVMVNAAPHEIKSLGIKDVASTKNPCTQAMATLTNIEHKAVLEEASFMVFDAPSRILLHLSAVLRKNAKDFITIQETQMMLDRLEHQFGALVKEVIPKAINLFQLTDVLKRLLSEEISIKDIKTILQTLAEFGPTERNTVNLTEHVRVALARYLCYRFGHGQETLLVYLLAPDIEDMIRSSIVNQGNGSYLALEPDIAQGILNACRYELGQLPPSATQPVLLTTQEIRRYVRKLIEIEFYEVAVMSYQELSNDFKVQPVGRISLQPEKVEDDHETFDESLDSPFAPVPSMM